MDCVITWFAKPTLATAGMFSAVVMCVLAAATEVIQDGIAMHELL
jgi:hypothetical protein